MALSAESDGHVKVAGSLAAAREAVMADATTMPAEPQPVPAVVPVALEVRIGALELRRRREVGPPPVAARFTRLGRRRNRESLGNRRPARRSLSRLRT